MPWVDSVRSCDFDAERCVRSHPAREGYMASIGHKFKEHSGTALLRNQILVEMPIGPKFAFGIMVGKGPKIRSRNVDVWSTVAQAIEAFESVQRASDSPSPLGCKAVEN